MKCRKCKEELPPNAKFCSQCGTRQSSGRKPKSRGNGTGSVYQLPNKKWKALIVLGVDVDKDGKKHRKTRSRADFATKREALEYLPTLRRAEREKSIAFKALYEKWKPTHKAGKSTMNCYNAAMNYFEDLWFMKISDIAVDDLQDCLDSCPKGKRTQENMKALAGLLYKYALPRDYVPSKLNLAQYVTVGGEAGGEKSALTSEDLDKLRAHVDDVPGAAVVLCHCYLGYRPTEFIGLDAKLYNRKEKAFIGAGIKTDAGKNRTVTVSPKIQPYIDARVRDKLSGAVFTDDGGKAFDIKAYREYFYNTLQACGIDNPITVIDGQEHHKKTPHSCRHTFATLMKRVSGADKDKQRLIGHSSAEQLRDYQSVEFDDIRAITNAI